MAKVHPGNRQFIKQDATQEFTQEFHEKIDGVEGASIDSETEDHPPRQEDSSVTIPLEKQDTVSMSLIQEMKRTGIQIQRECSDVFREVSATLREDLRREIQKIADGKFVHNDESFQVGTPTSRKAGRTKLSSVTFSGDHMEEDMKVPSVRTVSVCQDSRSIDGQDSSQTTQGYAKCIRAGGLWHTVSDGGAWADSVPKPIGRPDHPEEAPPPLPCEVPTTAMVGPMATPIANNRRIVPNKPSATFQISGSNRSNRSCISYVSPSYRPSEYSDKIDVTDVKVVKEARARLSISREKARVEAARMKKLGKPIHKLSIEELIKTAAFDNFLGFIILCNAATIGIQTDYNAKERTEEVPVSFYVIEQCFAAWFTLELALRLYVLRCSFFNIKSEGWQWNYFDLLVVMAQLMEVFFEFVARSTSVDASNFRVLRVLRILRLVRILRVVRVLHLISELRAIMSSIMGSFRSLIWVVVLLLLMIYIVAVFFTQSVTDHRITLAEKKKDYTENDKTLAYYFSSMGRAILSLWQAMSGGIDWDTLAGPMFDDLNFITGMAFACFIAFGVLALMNVVTGVFVQTALLSAREEEDTFMRSQVIALFHIADKEDKNAVITSDEIMESLSDPKTAKDWKSIGVQAEDARDLFKLLDVDNEEQVSFEEFMGGCLRLNGTAKAFDLLTVMQEQRKNEEFRKIWALHVDANLDESLTKTQSIQEDVTQLLRMSSSITKQVCSCSDDVAVILTSLAKEMTELKQILRPIRVMEDMLHTNGNGHHVPGVPEGTNTESSSRYSLV